VQLEVDGEPVVNSPTAGDVRDSLTRLKASGPRWAVLDLKTDYYFQAGIGEDELFDVAYHEGSNDRHYKAGSPQPRELVIDAFLEYLTGGNRWRTAFEWRREALP
jgi:hypothetical protein